MKKLKKFKKANVIKALEPDEIIEPSIEDDKLPVTIIKDAPALGIQTVKLLDQLEKVGFTAIASKLRELQVTEGMEAIEPMIARLQAIENQVDDALSNGETIGPSELKALLKLTIDAYQARAKALILPYGSISARTAIQGNRGHVSGTNIAIGIGTGVTPRAKN